jgi:drug/metabolite transporter (DMT)-like permease
MSAACQMCGGGMALLLTALLTVAFNDFEPVAVSLVSLSAFTYLVIFGPMVAISSYVWLLQNASATSVSTYAFVNPAVAIFLGGLMQTKRSMPISSWAPRLPCPVWCW